MMRYVFIFLFSFSVLAACQDVNSNRASTDRAAAFTSVTQLEDSLSQRRFDVEMANRLALQQVAFADLFPKDSVSPQMLLNAASLRSAANQPAAAVQLINKYLVRYEKHLQAPNAMLLLGQMQESLGEIDKAKVTFEKVKTLFPNSEQAKGAEGFLKLINTPDLNKLIEQFEKDRK